MNRGVLIAAGIALSLAVPGSIQAQRGRGGQGGAPVTPKAAAPECGKFGFRRSGGGRWLSHGHDNKQKG